MSTSQRERGSGWGGHLSPERFARALAAAGVLAAIDAARRSAQNSLPALNQGSAGDLLREQLGSLVEVESPLLQWAMPVDSNRVPPTWMPPPEQLEHVWHRTFEEREQRFRQRFVVDGQGRQRNDPPSTGPRLELPADFDLLEDATKSLVNRHTRVESLSALVDRKTKKLEWNWPVKMRLLATPGVTPGTLKAFRKKVLQRKTWLAEHLTLLPEDTDGRADFALLFADGRAAASTFLDRAEATISADCLIVVTPAPRKGDTQTTADALNEMLGRLGAFGIVSQTGMRASDDAAVSWVVEFVRELSHAVTVDVAAMRAAKATSVKSPTMRLSRALLDHAHVSRRRALILSRLKANPSSVVRGIPQPALQALRVGASVTARALAQALQARVTRFDFDRESNGALVISALAAVVARLPLLAPVRHARPPVARSTPMRGRIGPIDFARDAASAPPLLRARRDRPSEGTRFLQAQLLSVQDDRLVDDFKALMHGGECVVRVRIGGEERAWPSFGDEPFPTDQLPPTVKGWQLQVYLFTNTDEPAQSTTLFLPKTGNSDPCEFKSRVGSGLTPFKARVVIAFGNRVLQSAWLEAPVQDENGAVRGSFARGLEMVVRPNLAGLDSRSEFGAFIVLNDSLTQGPGVAIASGPSAVLRTPPDLAKTIAFIDGELTKISDEPEKYEGGLESKAVVRLLRTLAQYGRLMYEAIVEDQQVDQALIDAKRVQVVAAESWARLPIEFFYDQPAPEANAPLCPGAVKCLGGAMAAAPALCNDACPAVTDGAEVICPRGFWGLRKVIEWHRHSGDKSRDADFRLQSEPDTQRKPIKVFQSVLFAHSDRVDLHYAQASADVLAALKQASTQTNTASDWDIWRTGISSYSPLLMVMLPHNEESSNAIPELSIGPGTQPTHRLLLSSITSKIVKGPGTAPGAIVMVLGCETGAPKTSYLDYVPKFRRHGASIILSTGAVVLGRQISPICVRLIKGLQAAVSTGPAPLGEVMLRLRREALAEGFPIVLALSASGDADWLIE